MVSPSPVSTARTRATSESDAPSAPGARQAQDHRDLGSRIRVSQTTSVACGKGLRSLPGSRTSSSGINQIFAERAVVATPFSLRVSEGFSAQIRRAGNVKFRAGNLYSPEAVTSPGRWLTGRRSGHVETAPCQGSPRAGSCRFDQLHAPSHDQRALRLRTQSAAGSSTTAPIIAAKRPPNASRDAGQHIPWCLLADVNRARSTTRSSVEKNDPDPTTSRALELTPAPRRLQAPVQPNRPAIPVELHPPKPHRTTRPPQPATPPRLVLFGSCGEGPSSPLPNVCPPPRQCSGRA